MAIRKREKGLRAELANEIRDALLADANSGSFNRLDSSRRMREAAVQTGLNAIEL
jgi:hypothetical protein